MQKQRRRKNPSHTSLENPSVLYTVAESLLLK